MALKIHGERVHGHSGAVRLGWQLAWTWPVDENFCDLII